MNETTKDNAKPYDVIQFEVFTDTFMEVHACGCKHRKPFSDVTRREYIGNSLEELKKSVAHDVNCDLASDHGLNVEEYIEKEGGYFVSTKEGADVRIMPCVKFPKEA